MRDMTLRRRALKSHGCGAQTRRAGRERGLAGRERRPSGGGGRASATIGPGQFQQLQASVERRAEEEAARLRAAFADARARKAAGRPGTRATRSTGRGARWIERHTANVCRRCCASLTAAMQTGIHRGARERDHQGPAEPEKSINLTPTPSPRVQGLSMAAAHPGILQNTAPRPRRALGSQPHSARLMNPRHPGEAARTTCSSSTRPLDLPGCVRLSAAACCPQRDFGPNYDWGAMPIGLRENATWYSNSVTCGITETA